MTQQKAVSANESSGQVKPIIIKKPSSSDRSTAIIKHGNENHLQSFVSLPAVSEGKYLKDDGTTGTPSASVSWGDISGTLSSQMDLSGALAGKADTHSHPYASNTHNHSLSSLSEKSYSSLTDKPTIPDQLSDLSDDATHRTVTDTEKSTWNGKSDAHSHPYEPADAAIQAHITSSHAPSSAEQNVNADWNASSGDAQILNKPSIPTQYTDELAQDAVGAMLTGGSLAYNDATPLLSLANDNATPGNNKAYGTDAVGTKGWRDFPAAGAHDLGGTSHNADTLANLNAKISDADVIALAGQIGGTAASPDVRGIRETSGPTLLTTGAIADGEYLRRSGSTLVGGTPSGGVTPAWKGNIVSCWNDGDPHWVIDSLLHNPINATPTNISITVARCAFFKLDTAITVNKIRWYGVGATTGLYHVAVYRLSDLARLAILDDFNTAAATWGSGAFSVSLSADTIYFIAVSVDTVGTTAGVGCHSATNGRIGVLPTSWPGNLQINAASPKINALGFCQFTVTTGALPNPAATLALQAAWTGGMPAFFLDNNNS